MGVLLPFSILIVGHSVVAVRLVSCFKCIYHHARNSRIAIVRVYITDVFFEPLGQQLFTLVCDSSAVRGETGEPNEGYVVYC